MKNILEKIVMWIKYKKFRKCKSCKYFIDSKCKRFLFTYDKEFKYCRRKRSYNIAKWIKNLTILCVITILSVSCVTINVYTEPNKELKTNPIDSTKTESYWF